MAFPDLSVNGGIGEMEQYKQDFIEFMVDSQVLKFGDFTLKSGRISFFHECGGICDGQPA